MEYAMCTLITGEREFGSLVGVTAHEMAHSWFQHILATDEAQHEWMDEGFTSYISALAMNEVMDQNRDNVFAGTYRGYTSLANSGFEQPQTTHADRYEYNRAYGVTAYSKGAVFLAQLGYLIGQENLDNTLNRYFDEWKFKHPTPNDFIRIAEKVSGAELSWYLNDWTRTTNTIDYAIKGVSVEPGTTIVTLERVALTPMPIEVKVDFKGGTSETYYIPLRIMRWTKPGATNIQEDWAWAFPTYTLEIPSTQYGIEKIEIDPSGLMADVNRENNVKVLNE
jgi:aminopeptidase N